jgi:hypothetical protein
MSRGIREIVAGFGLTLLACMACQIARVMLTCILFAPIANACSDDDCGPQSTNLKRAERSCSGVPFLSASNDSRLNLQLLMLDRSKLHLTPLQPPRFSTPTRSQVPFSFPEQWKVTDQGMTGQDSSAQGSESGESFEYADGEGSRCLSARSGAVQFGTAANAAKDIPKEELEILLLERKNLANRCREESSTRWAVPDGIHSSAGLQFAAYIQGADAFYAGDFRLASGIFNGLRDAADPWLKETARYMVGRTELSSAGSLAFNGEGLAVDKVDKSALEAAKNAFLSYLHEYPHGLYTASAFGLLRRVDWLGGDRSKLAADYADILFGNSPPSPLNVTLQMVVFEADKNVMSASNLDEVQSPQMLASMDLMRMRRAFDGVPEAATFTWESLQAQKPRFAAVPELHTYLLAAYRYYKDHDYSQVLALLPAAAGAPTSYLSFSAQTLRGFALEESGRTADAQQLWLRLLSTAKLPLQREQLELALAMNEERSKQIEKVFAPNSPITDEGIRTTLIERSASAEVLRKLVKEKTAPQTQLDAALHTLLYREFTYRQYQAFIDDLALVPTSPAPSIAPFVSSLDASESGYPCPKPREVAESLRDHPNDGHNLNCWAEFVRFNSPGSEVELQPGADELGGAPSQFAGSPSTRMDAYIKVIEDDHNDSDARAFALYRAVNCFEPVGSNACGKDDIPLSKRKGWFRDLKLNYGNSKWSQQQKYYW